MKSISGIYKIVNLVNNKIYIGSSVYTSNRWKMHKKELRDKKHGNSYLLHAWEVYGADSFRFEVIEEVESFDTTSLSKGDYRTMLLAREQHYIDTLKPEYNICQKAGSRLGTTQSDEARQKVRDSHARPEVKEKMRNAKLGTKQSDEMIDKRMKNMRGRVHSAEEIENRRKALTGKKRSGKALENIKQGAKKRIGKPPSENVKKGVAARLAKLAALSPEEKAELSRTRSEKLKQSWAKLTPEERQARNKNLHLGRIKAWEAVSPEDKAAMMKKACDAAQEHFAQKRVKG